MKIILGISAATLFLTACSDPTPKKPDIPGLTAQAASDALHYNGKAQDWINHARRQDPSCEFNLDIPDQSSHPTTLDFEHIVQCGGKKAPLELNASVSFEYDKNAQHWVITRFSD